eukprot:GFKZ01000886.1.p1 GENE.GFKZ01000886.1~~GFKZ01000886.1.p1  ORF type:complete len:662 (-),score=116.41 GFKZ01000886.1:254-2239(-)
MSRPSFRPRPIDLTKPLPIVWSGAELRVDDEVVVNRALPAVATGVDPAEETERHLKQALMASVYGDERRAAVDIPIPVVRPVKPPERSGLKWERPSGYIMFDKSDHDLEDDCVDYDADHLDVTFVEKVGGGLGMDVFERAMDGIEKVQGRSNTPDLLPYDAMKPVLHDILNSVAESVRKEVYQHWFKRRTERGRPFLRLYQPAPDPSNSDPSVAFRPRDRDGAGGMRRMNTYENYKRAELLRDDLRLLSEMLEKVVERERQKTLLLSVQLLQQRTKVMAEGGSRVDAVTRSIFSGEQEPVVLYGPASSQVMVPCRNLVLPKDIEVVHKRLGNLALEKAPKKTRRKAATKVGSEKLKGQAVVSNSEQKVSASGSGSAVDTFGFDDLGNKFLRQMRYFAGGFMNYGVSPYDHRVFSAASERNTVRVDPTEPKPVELPSAAVGFGDLRCSGEEDVVHNEARLENGDSLKTGDICVDIIGDKRGPEFKRTESPPRKAARVIRARARLGRGGRVVFDRVVFERERGAKAASYPASVEMGGVYTAGIPLDSASKVGREVEEGELGNILRLGSGFDEAEERERWSADSDEGLSAAKRLIPAMKPVMGLNAGVEVSPGVVSYWPSRKRGGKRGRKEVMSKRAKGSDETEDELRKLPAYSTREEPLVSEI